jgi:hypothetical protein
MCTIDIQYFIHLSVILYWLDIFAQCLPPFFHQGVSSNPTFDFLKKYDAG